MPIHFDPTVSQQLGRLDLLARQTVTGFITGRHRSPSHGFSVEFAEHRLYNTGESTRHLDWKLYARTDRLYTKRYEEETNLRAQVLIDQSASMFYPKSPGSANRATARSAALQTKVGFAVHAAAALTELFRRQRDAVGLALFDEEIAERLPARSSAAHLGQVYHRLENLLDQSNPPAIGSALLPVLHEIAEQVPRRSLVILFSDFLDPQSQVQDPGALDSALQHLRHCRHEVILFHVLDRSTESDFDFADRPTRFVDVETGHELRLTPSEVRDAYRDRMASLSEHLRLTCAKHSVDLVPVDVAEGVHPVLQAYLSKRSRLLSRSGRR
jgi:uncharacterized protein (DUF58 family)